MQAGIRVDLLHLLGFLFSCGILSSLKKQGLATCSFKCQKEMQNEVEIHGHQKPDSTSLWKHCFWLMLEQATRHRGRRAGPGNLGSSPLLCNPLLHPLGSFPFSPAIYVCMSLPGNLRSGHSSVGRASVRREEPWVEVLSLSFTNYVILGKIKQNNDLPKMFTTLVLEPVDINIFLPYMVKGTLRV